MCDEIRKLGALAEVCNQIEFEKATEAGISFNKIIYNELGKKGKVIEHTILAGSIVNVDSLE